MSSASSLLTLLAAGETVDWFLHVIQSLSVLLVLIGLALMATATLGDLGESMIKRDLGIKDWAATFPGHGGLLDRFNSLLFAAPAVFHYVGYLQGIGLNQVPRIITHG